MEKSSKYFPIRRSTRLPLEIPVRVTGLDSNPPMAEDCTTVTVSAHGCGVVSPRKLAAGTRVQLEIVADKKATKARVLEVVPLNDENTSWLLGMEMEHPGNFWGIKYAPADWIEEEAAAEPAPAAPATIAAKSEPPPQAPRAKAGAPAFHGETPRAAAAKSAAVPQTAVTPGKATAQAPSPKVVSPSASAKPAPAAPPTAKEIPAAVMRRLLSDCRLAAISVGACYVQTGTTFPMHAPVKFVVQTGGKEHSFHGTVRVEHVGSGMGLEFSGSGEEHAKRIAELIDALGADSEQRPQVRVELAAPDKQNPPKSKTASAAAAQYDSLLGLVLVGGSLKRSDFLHELEKQRRRS